MRRRSGALHCETQQQLIELASNHQMGLYYNEGPQFKELKMDHQWNFTQAQDPNSFSLSNYQLETPESEETQETLELSRGLRYLENCVVDQEAIRCSIEICIIASKIQQILNKILSKDSLLELFIHTKETTKNCIYKHSSIQSFPNSNVFSLETSNVECSKMSHSNKENLKMTPKNWLKNPKTQKMLELLIVKKHISISQNSEIGPRRITIIHRLFIVNEKYLLNSLIKIYLQKSHFVLDTRGETFRPQNGPQNLTDQDQNHLDSTNRTRKPSLYNKIFHHKTLFERDCIVYNRGQFLSSSQTKTDTCLFKHSFHKIQERIAKDYMRKLNDILVQEKRKCESEQKGMKK